MGNHASFHNSCRAAIVKLLSDPWHFHRQTLSMISSLVQYIFFPLLYILVSISFDYVQITHSLASPSSFVTDIFLQDSKSVSN